MEPSELINRGIEAELSFSAVRSSGPGGQNVNKVSTAVEMRFHEAKDFVASWDYTLMSISLPS